VSDAIFEELLGSVETELAALKSILESTDVTGTG
jgi:hypothetical protein